MWFSHTDTFFICGSTIGYSTLNRGVLLNYILCNSYKKEKYDWNFIHRIIIYISDNREPPDFDWVLVRKESST